MKTLLKSLYGLGVAAALLSITACEPDNPPAPPAASTLKLRFDGVFGSKALSFGTPDFVKADGETLIFDQFKLLFSNVSLIREDGSRLKLGDGYAYADFKANATSTQYFEVPIGSYKGISLTVGLDSATNHGDPAQWPADHPLSPLNNGMHWGWAGGYIFSMLDGNYIPKGSSTKSAFSFHMATMRYVRTIDLLFPFTKVPGKNTLAVRTDAEEYFKNPYAINFVKDGSFSHSTGSEVSLMDKLFTNIEDIFTNVTLE
ncbi:MAG: hypothetical protein KJS92_00280 [Bacteroidetes bacterium]|nr:hypothetical protein [Bacteroidota bacterium]